MFKLTLYIQIILIFIILTSLISIFYLSNKRINSITNNINNSNTHLLNKDKK